MGVGSHTWLVAGVAAACLSAGCSDAGGAGGSAGGAGGGASIEYGTTACNECVQGECASQVSACETDPSCAAYWQCLQACPTNGLNEDADSACDDACSGDASSQAVKLRAELKGCRFFGAGAEACQTCGYSFSTDLPTSDQSCTSFELPDPPPDDCACVFEQCCETWTAREADPGSAVIMDCVQACTDSDCYESCFQATPDSADIWTAQFACRWVHCAGERENCDASTRNDCDACAYQTCGDSFEDVLEDPEAFVLWICTAVDCESDNFSAACIEDCYDAYPAGQEKNLLWVECLDEQCTLCEGS